MNALITGASGFVGRHLIELLREKGVDISSLGLSSILGADHHPLSLPWNKKDLVNVIKNVQPDYFFHLAGSTSSRNLQEAFTTNTCLGSDLLDAIEMAGFQDKTKCLLFGSAAEYGLINESDLPLDENFYCNPYSNYGICKLAQTHYATAWARAGGKAIVVRPFTIIGKQMPTSLAIGNFAKQIINISKKGHKGTLYTGDIEVSRDFLDVSDVVEICWNLVNINESNGHVINVCSGQALSLKMIIEYMIYLSGVDISIEFESDRVRDIDMKTHFGDNKKMIGLMDSYEFTPWQLSIREIMGIP